MKYQAPIGAADPDDPYVDGNPATGTPGSPVPAKAIEHPMREINAFIEAGGLVPDENDLSQLLKAFKSGGGLAKSFTPSGYQVLPGGLIIQWGEGTLATATGEGSIVLPIAFPNGILYGDVHDAAGASFSGLILGTWRFDLSSTTNIGFEFKNTGVSPVSNFRWFTIGH